MKQLTLVLLPLLVACTAFAQSSESNTSVHSYTRLDLGFQGVGFTYEPRLSRRMSLDLSAGAGGGYDIAEGSLSYNIALFRPAFYFSATPKLYYNREKRNRQGKSIALNAGNYFGLRLKYVTPNDRRTDQTRNSVLVNLHWGMQRAIAARWTFNAHAGIGYGHDIDYNFGTPYPALDVRFAYIIGGVKP